MLSFADCLLPIGSGGMSPGLFFMQRLICILSIASRFAFDSRFIGERYQQAGEIAQLPSGCG